MRFLNKKNWALEKSPCCSVAHSAEAASNSHVPTQINFWLDRRSWANPWSDPSLDSITTKQPRGGLGSSRRSCLACAYHDVSVSYLKETRDSFYSVSRGTLKSIRERSKCRFQWSSIEALSIREVWDPEVEVVFWPTVCEGAVRRREGLR